MAKDHSPRFLKIVDEARAKVRECSVHDVRQRLEVGESFHLIDVREESEFGKSHIPGAVHLGKGVIERDIEQEISEPSAAIVVYCGGGYRSALAAENLGRMGYTNVISMDGGFRGWREAGYDVESGKGE